MTDEILAKMEDKLEASRKTHELMIKTVNEFKEELGKTAQQRDAGYSENLSNLLNKIEELNESMREHQHFLQTELSDNFYNAEGKLHRVQKSSAKDFMNLLSKIDDNTSVVAETVKSAKISWAAILIFIALLADLGYRIFFAG